MRARLDRADPPHRRAALRVGHESRGRRPPRSKPALFRLWVSSGCAVSLCQGAKRIAVAGHDFVSLFHFLLEAGVVGSEPIFSLRRLNKKKLLAIASAKPLDDFLGK